MNILTLDWFKSQKQIEIERLKVKEQKLKNKLLKKKLKDNLNTINVNPADDDFQERNVIWEELKPYSGLKLVNDVLTITLNNGDVIVKPCATQEDFIAVRNAYSEEDIFIVTAGKEIVEENKKEQKEYNKAIALKDGIDKLAHFKDFKIIDDSVYLKGVDRSLPQLLVEKFLEIINYEKGEDFERGEIYNYPEYLALKQFWLKCCLNPNANSAEDLYTFLSFHQFKIDKHGNFYAYRRVVSKANVNKELVDFVSNAYNKVKAVWKKNPASYNVHKKVDEGYFFMPESNTSHKGQEDISFLGNLKELYLNLPDLQENSYTSSHTGIENYHVGSIVSMPRNDGDDDNSVSCSKGFHAASKEYDYSGFGDVPILVIINPIDVLAVPLNEIGKLRTCRWFFSMTLSEDEQHILDDDDFDVAELGDVFEEKCSENLENYVHNSFAEEVKRHTFTIPEMSHTQINKIVKSLNEMTEEIKGRIQQI